MTEKKNKEILLEKLYEPYKKCLLCPLATPARKSVVFGHGNANAQFMIIGEAPGKDENEYGIPFVGKSGRLLTKILTDIGINRNEIFVTNSVKCRPPNNRKPTKLELATCTDILLFNQIKIIEPQAICTLGSVATSSLLKTPIQMNSAHGKIHYFNNLIVFPTYHPAYVLRNPQKKEEFINDLKNFFSLFSGRKNKKTKQPK